MTTPPTTRIVAVDPDQPDPSVIDMAAQVLLRGGLVAFATETVYGLGGIATDAVAVARIFAAKERPAINPVIVHVAGVAQARGCVARTRSGFCTLRAVAQGWGSALKEAMCR